MRNTCSSKVTITLGRSGQVVKRPGSKRSITDTLQHPLPLVDNKRQHGLSFKRSNTVDDTHLSKHDLRFKIKKQTQRKTVDLRDILSRKIRPISTDNRVDWNLRNSRSSRHRPRQLTPEPRNSRQRALQVTPEPMNIRRCIPELKNDQWRLPQTMGEKQPQPTNDHWRVPQTMDMKEPLLEPRDGRRLMGGPIEVGPQNPTLYDDRERITEPTNRVHSVRTSKTLSQMDLSGNSFSLSTLDQIRPRSPNRVLDNVEHLTVESFLHSLGLDKYLISFKVEEVDMATLRQMGEHDLKEMGIHMGPRKKIMLALLACAKRQAR